MRRLVAVNNLPTVPYPYAATVSGTTLFTAGACPLDDHGRVVAASDIQAQARCVLENLLVVLRAAGCEFEDVVKTTVYVASDERADLAAVWTEVETAFGEEVPPSTLVGVTVLGWPDQRVEIEAVAACRVE